MEACYLTEQDEMSESAFIYPVESIQDAEC